MHMLCAVGLTNQLLLMAAQISERARARLERDAALEQSIAEQLRESQALEGLQRSGACRQLVA